MACVAGACSGPPTPLRPEIWATDDIHAPTPVASWSEDAELFDHEARRFAVAGAAGETLGFHLAVAATDRALPAIDLAVVDLQSGDATIPATTVRFHRLHSVQVEHWPGWHIRLIEPSRRRSTVPDVVVPADAPVGGLPADVPPGQTLHLWVDIDIPDDAEPGSYDGTLIIRSRRRVVEALGLTLTVWPFRLPHPSRPVLLADLDHRALFAHHLTYNNRPYGPPRILATNPLRQELEFVLTRTMRMLAEHGVSPVLPRLYPTMKIGVNRELKIDWADYDRVVQGFLNGSGLRDARTTPLWPIPFNEAFPPPPSYGAMHSPTYAATVRDYLRHCATHFDEMGWLDRSYVVIPHADTISAEAWQAVGYFGAIMQAAHPRLRRLCALFPQDMTTYGWQGFPHGDVSSFVDIWCPPAQFYDPALEPNWFAPEQSTWLHLDRPPFSGSVEIAAPPDASRVIPWQGFRLDCPVIALGCANDATMDAVDLTPQACIDRRPDLLIYPGRPFQLSLPVASMRLKRLRRGMQDLAYVQLLNEHELSHVAETIAESLAPFAAAEAYGAHFADGRPNAWVTSPQWWSLARRVMADELIRRIEGAEADGVDQLAGTLRWRQFMTETRKVDVRVDGVRVRPAGGHKGEAVIHVRLTITNHTRVPVVGTLAFEELPVGWSTDPAPVDVPRIQPGRAVRVTLTARAGAVTWDNDGVRYLPIRFDYNRRTRRFAARLAFVPAPRLAQPVPINGDLSDWPVAPGNVASDFVLITGEPQERSNGRAGRPASATRCHVGRDRDYLYFGFHCASGGTPDLEGRSNLVHYEDMVPVGEDLVEVIIDPDATDTRSTGDLYHLVVKLSGACWERGIGTEPPTGPRCAWAADIRHAARWCGDHWEAEVRIPLTAFGRPLRDHEVWALNITRFDAVAQEYSNWAGAVTNVYDPLSLGNLGL